MHKVWSRCQWACHSAAARNVHVEKVWSQKSSDSKYEMLVESVSVCCWFSGSVFISVVFSGLHFHDTWGCWLNSTELMALICSVIDDNTVSLWPGPDFHCDMLPSCPGTPHDCSRHWAAFSPSEVKSVLWTGSCLGLITAKGDVLSWW